MLYDKTEYSIRSIILTLIYVLNSMVLYIPRVYSVVYNGYFTYLLAGLLMVLVFATEGFRIKLSTALMTTIILFVAYVDTQVNGLPIGEYFPLVWFVIVFICICQFNVSELCTRLMCFVNLSFWIYLVLYSLVYHSYFQGMIYDYEVYEGVLNPNTVGIGIAQFFLLWDITRDNEKNSIKIKHLLFIVSIIAIVYCQARSAAVFLVIGLLGEFLIKKMAIKHSVLVKSGMSSIVVMGFAFPLIFIYLYRRLGPEVTFLGKKLFTGRERIWGTLLNYLNNNKQAYFWGSGKMESLNWHGIFNLHNSYLAFFSEYGLLVTILFWVWVLVIAFRLIDDYRALRFKKKSVLSETVVKSIGFIVFSLLLAYTETNYTYILSIIYIVFAFGVSYRKEHKNDT